MDIRTVTVFGASGRQGMAQVRKLLQEGFAVRAITRQKHLLEGREFAEASILPADYDDVESLDRACRGADAIFYQSAQFDTRESILRQSTHVADAAKRAGVKRFVHNSTMWAPDEPCGQPLYDSVLELENAMAEHDLPLVIFRPVLFMDNLLTSYCKPGIVAESRYCYPQKADLKMDYICLDDVAAFMIEALRRQDLIGERFRIGGPQTLTPIDVVKILSAVLGKQIRHEYVTPRDFGQKFYDISSSALDIPRDAYVDFFDAFYTFNNDSPYQPFRCDMSEVLKRIPIRLTAMRDWAARQDWTLDSPRVGSASG